MKSAIAFESSPAPTLPIAYRGLPLSRTLSQVARRIRGIPSMSRMDVAIVISGVLLAFGGAWLIEARLTDLVLAQVAARAIDQVELGVLSRVTEADFQPPYSLERLEALNQRLDPLLARMQNDGSGVIRLHMHARDGTIIYSDRPSQLGEVVPPLSVPLLTSALEGSLGTQRSSLLDPEDADLKSRYDGALEVHVPVVLNGQVVGAYQMYQDLAPIRPIRPLAWGGGAVLGLLGTWLYVVARIRAIRVQHEQNEPQHRIEEAAPPPKPIQVSPGLGLSPRELEVLQLMATTCTYREIAHQLMIGEETVRSHAKSILNKLGQRDRAQAVIAAMRAGILQLS
jgi:DNA-binding CsgD family transcriptional regulator